MSYVFHPAAEAEFRHAVDYYEDIEAGLGLELAAEVYAAISRALEYPDAWAVLEGQVRRSLVRRFPYGVLYAVVNDELYILAVMNLHRDPEYWKSRQ